MSTLRERIEGLRSAGWMVAVHNDYRQNGEFRTFWLFVKDGRAIKGEGRSDDEAVELAAALVAEGQGDAWLDPKSLGIPLQHEPRAAAPSLHKEARPAGCICSEAYGVGPEQCGKHGLHKEGLTAPDDGNIWSEVRRLTEIRLRSTTTQEPLAAFSADDVRFLLSLIDQRDRAFKELTHITAERAALHKEGAGGEPLASTSIITPRRIEWFCQFCQRNHVAHCPVVVQRLADSLRAYMILASDNECVQFGVFGAAKDALAEFEAASPAGRAEQADAPKETK